MRTTLAALFLFLLLIPLNVGCSSGAKEEKPKATIEPPKEGNAPPADGKAPKVIITNQ